MIYSWKVVYTCDDNYVDETSIDEESEELAWDLYAEFGHIRCPKCKIEMWKYDSTDEGEIE